MIRILRVVAFFSSVFRWHVITLRKTQIALGTKTFWVHETSSYSQWNKILSHISKNFIPYNTNLQIGDFFQKGFAETQNILTTRAPALSPGSYGTLKLSGSLLFCSFSSFCLSCAITAIISKKTQWNQKLEGKNIIGNQTC